MSILAKHPQHLHLITGHLRKALGPDRITRQQPKHRVVARSPSLLPDTKTEGPGNDGVDRINEVSSARLRPHLHSHLTCDHLW